MTIHVVSVHCPYKRDAWTAVFMYDLLYACLAQMCSILSSILSSSNDSIQLSDMYALINTHFCFSL